MTPDELTKRLKDEAIRLGFDLAGVCSATEPEHFEHFSNWLASGCAGTMTYLAERGSAYRHPRGVLDGVQSLLVLGASYRAEEPAQPQSGQGRVSRYAWGLDYHDVIHDRLHRLADFHRELTPQAAVRGVVDTAPLFEREFAQRAGLGWIGRNTMLINRDWGSWLFLAVLLTSENLTPDDPASDFQCGQCRACLDACPTGALIGPYQLDARRCISYLTIEHRGPIDEEFCDSIGDRVFGCDACQEVCPWNRRAARGTEKMFQPCEGTNPLDLVELFDMDDAAFRRRFRHTPFWRTRRAGLLRNAAIVLGNSPSTPVVIAALTKGLDDPDPAVQDACTWALARHR